jgi:hypothetical protein
MQKFIYFFKVIFYLISNDIKLQQSVLIIKAILTLKKYQIINFSKISWILICYIYITFCYIFLTFNHEKWLNPKKSEI